MTNRQKITQMRQVPDGLLLRWKDGRESLFHSIWLRDNCRCEECGEPAIGRRKSRLSQISLDISITSLVMNGMNVELTWSDRHQSFFSGDWLSDHAYDEESRHERHFVPELWNHAFRQNPVSFDFSDANTNERVYLQVLEAVRDHGICFLKDAPAEDGVLEPFASRIGPIQESNFGRIQDLVVDLSRNEVAQSAIALKPHTDEPYRASPPGILLFLCIRTDVTGAGSSTFVDGFEIAETLRREDSEGFDILKKMPNLSVAILLVMST
jgi:gamma-butyrobetaine dioxygenase